MTMITPAVGRKVYFYETFDQQEPWDATIIKVHDAVWNSTPFSKVNLQAIDPETGQAWFIPSVTCNPNPTEGPRYCWMPYQMAQLERALDRPPSRTGLVTMPWPATGATAEDTSPIKPRTGYSK